MKDLSKSGAKAETEFGLSELKKSGANQKHYRAHNFSTGREKVAISYRENTPKEELVLEHVLEWKSHFAATYGTDRPLLLAPQNETGVCKFVCTTLRPTKLPYKELYNWESCSKFISNFLEYEELSPPNELPALIPSPANVLAWQVGDCFDFAILLCSLLIGNGYESYVIYGKAPREITSRDESMLSCPIIQIPVFPKDEEEEIKAPSKEQPSKVKLEETQDKVNEPATSIFDTVQKQKVEEEKKGKARLETEITDDEPEYEPADPYKKERLHCWVLVKRGKREVKESFFIEPTTGRKYAIKDSPYDSVECIFNHRNFWVNMKPKLPVDQVGIEDFDYKEGCEKEWEYVMLPTVHKKLREMDEGSGNFEVVEDEETREDILDMPTPWSPKLIIKKDAPEEMCVAPQKTVFYVRSKIDIYAPYSLPDGMVCRLVYYQDYKRLLIKEIRAIFANRADKLVLRRRFPYEFKTIEEYAPGKKTALGVECHLKKLIQVDGQKRQLYYYPHRNTDGLIYREEQILHKTIEVYKSRPDKLIYRSVTFDASKAPEGKDVPFKELHSKGDVTIRKMTLKYELDTTRPPEIQHRKVVINYDKKKLFEYFHYSKNNVKESFNEILIESIKSNEANDKEVEKSGEAQKREALSKIIKECIGDITKQEASAIQEIEVGFKGDIFEKGIYDKAREKARNERKQQEGKDTQEDERDYLAPTLAKLQLENEFKNYKKGDPFPVELARKVQSEVFQMHKERIKARAKIIQDRLDNEVKAVQRQFDETTTNPEKMTREQKDKYQVEYSEASLRISILTERAYQQYQYALEKFKEIERLIANDPRFALLRESS